MRKLVIAAALIVLIPSSSYAWGASVHRLMMRRAIELLPAEIQPFFVGHADEIVLRANDPDLWRTVGWEDDPNHFINFGVPEFGAYPFVALPREFGAAIEKFGIATLKRDGMLPWRVFEEFGNLRRAFEGFAQQAPYSVSNTVLFSAIAAHYLQDAHEPLHATNNYDGQLTGQAGLHTRFESTLFELFESRLTIRQAARPPITDPRKTVFDVLLDSYKLVDSVLAADKAAIGTKDMYDDEYFGKFFAGVKPIIEQRLADSISDTAALIAGAWQAAGRPVLRDQMPRRIQPVRKPQPHG